MGTALRSAVPVIVLSLFGCRPDDAAVRAQMAGVSELDVAWSYAPASGLLAVARDSGEPGLILVDTRGHEAPRELPTNAFWPRHPALSPDGRWLAYHEFQRGSWSWEKRLFLLDQQTQRTRILVEASDDDFVGQVAFSPNGKWLVYELVHKRPSWQNELRIVDLATLTNRSLFFDGHTEAHAPAWTPDSRALFVASGPCLRRIDAASGTISEVACVDGARGIDGYQQPPAVSPDGSEVAFAVDLGECPQIFVIDSAARRTIDRIAGCGMRPVWLPGRERHIAYISSLGNGSRVPRVWSVSRRQSRSVGLDVGVAYDLVAEPSGDLLVLAASPTQPRAVWRVSTRDATKPAVVYSPIAGKLLDELQQRASVPEQRDVVSKDGLRVPILVFRPTGHTRRARGPAVLWIHGGLHGKEDVAPRWSQEIQFLAASGVTVVAVNYRGSTGYGTSYRERASDPNGQIEDVRAADQYLRALPYVDPDQIYILAVCYAGALAAPLVAAQPTRYRGAIHWMASASAWLYPQPPKQLPPLLWLYGAEEQGAASFLALAQDLQAEGFALRHLALPEGHSFLGAADRARSLDELHRFIEAPSEVRRAD